MKTFIALTLFAFTILFMENSFAHFGCGLNPICGDIQNTGEPIKYLPSTQYSRTVLSQQNEIDNCSNDDYQISIRNSDQGWLTALLTDHNGNLLAQFQIHFDQTMNDYVGQGFSLRSLNRPAYPVSRDVHFNAELVATGEIANGRMVCEPKKPLTEPAGKPQCHGMQMPSYINGAWHCISGGH